MKKTMLLFLLAAFALTACDNKNIHELVKQVAEAPVDTTGYVTKELAVSEYNSVMVDCFADVTFHQSEEGAEPRVVLQAPQEVLPNLSVRVKDEELVVETDRRYNMPEGVVAVVHLYSPFVNDFTLNGGKCLRLGTVNVSTPLLLDLNGVGALTADSIACPETTLHLNGAGSADLKGLKLQRLRIALNGSGRVYLQGEADEVVHEVNGDGLIHAEQLQEKKAEAPKLEPTQI
jgi:hypothetical protein